MGEIWQGDAISLPVTGRRRAAHAASERARRTSGAAAITPVEVARSIELVREAAPLSRAVTVMREVRPRSRSEMLNRAVNLVIAALALVILSPVIVLIALAIRLTSRGPVLYSQTRVGLDRRRSPVDALYDRRERDAGGHMFTIYKFRSMYQNAEQDCGEVWASREDPRVTPVGRFLRGTRLDELPQLINVLRGDMNIVGPRPERPSIFARLRENLPEYPLRQRTRPGITGWAQINHTYDRSIEDVKTKVRYDLEYLERQSLVEDLKIMVKTVPVMLFRQGGW